MKPETWGFWKLRLHVCIVWVGLVWLTAVACAQPASAPQEAIHFTQAQLLSVPGTGYSAPPPHAEDAALPRDGWQTVNLPHSVSRELVPNALSGVQTVTDWYRLDLTDLEPSTQQRLLYLPRWVCMGHIAVYADGVLIYQSHGSPVYNGYNHPLLLALNAAVHAPVPTSVLIRIDRLRGTGIAVSTAWVGDLDALNWRYQIRQLLQVQLPFMGSAAFLAVGIFAFAVWLGKQREPLYLFFSVTSALSFVRMLHYYVGGNYLPVSDAWFGWMSFGSLLWLTVLVHMFLQRLNQHTSVWLTRVLVAVALVLSVVTLPQASTWIPSLFLLISLLNKVLLLVAVLTFAVDLRNALRTRRSEGRLMAGWFVFTVVCVAYDTALQSQWVSPEGVYTNPYAIISLFFIASYAMFQRYAGAVAEVDRLNAGLAWRLGEREAELEQSYQRLRVIENQQLLAAERQRLMQDMHDGLGSSLTSAIRSVERGAMGVAQVSDVLKGCMDDLKLAIDSMDTVEADLVLLLATLRFRLAPRIEGAGVELRWEVQPVPALNWLDPASALHILRIVQESLANVLRHTRATRIGVSTAVKDGGVCVTVEDNGAGFVVDETMARSSRGMRNQQRRALAIGGTVEWESGSGGTRFTLWLPLDKALAAQPL